MAQSHREFGCWDQLAEKSTDASFMGVGGESQLALGS